MSEIICEQQPVHTFGPERVLFQVEAEARHWPSPTEAYSANLSIDDYIIIEDIGWTCWRFEAEPPVRTRF